MMEPPEYFERIRKKAEQRWIQLEQDPELAGPWHQLFKQVQSPRHVVSELLQNADDAGATEAFIDIINGEFVFSHNGEDFTEEHFASLCRFGYSNKRVLHTIGFRGIGFKSTFSLGDEVRLFTPTLSVALYRKRFTEPVWIEEKKNISSRTEIRVRIKDEYRQRELEKNLREWMESSASLLFFRSIRWLRIGQQEVRWISKGKGPVENSEWMVLSSNQKTKYLILSSEPENFPDDVLNEIRQERMLTIEEESFFPPCRVEIILGMEGRLFVILPTGVKTNLPFACNAPFIQDPARVKIKDPEISFTNRWLLKRVGKLAAKGMLAWLSREDMTLDSRCSAYSFLPDVNYDDNSLEGACARIVREAFEENIHNEHFLLTEDGTLVGKQECIGVPSEILNIWSSDQVRKIFDKDNRPILYRNVSKDAVKKLSNNKYVNFIDKLDVLNILESNHLPTPATWQRLLTLWTYIYGSHRQGNFRIVPVQGKNFLYPAKDVLRWSVKKLLQTDEDWEFLSKYLLVINSEWLNFLELQHREAKKKEDHLLKEQVEKALELLKAFKLNTASNVSNVIEQVAENFFSQNECSLQDCVRLTQIAAKLGASLKNNFQFVTRDGNKKSIDEHIIADINGDLDLFVSNEWYEKHVLHDEYWRNFISCTETEWKEWIISGRSGLVTFIPLVLKRHFVWRRDEFQKSLRERGFKEKPNYPFITNDFLFEDWDFDEEHWDYWKSLSQKNSEFWGHLFAHILAQSKKYWSNALTAKAYQISTTKSKRLIAQDILPSWIVKFRSLPCLRDTMGYYRQPAELLRRTPETEALLEVEHFIRAEDDNEHIRPLLIKLGVRDTPTGPDRLLERLRALATVENPPISEVAKWYRHLDQMLVKCSTEEFQQIKETFANEKIILTDNIEWMRTAEVFLNANEEDVPDAPIVHASVRHLTLWQKIGVSDRPTVELALNWLKKFPSGQKLSQQDLKRVRSLLSRYARQIWQECKHCLNLEGEWVPVDSLEFKLTKLSLAYWQNLFSSIKQKTADLRQLSDELCQQSPFSGLPSLAASIEEHFQEDHQVLSRPQKKIWIIELGKGLCRIIFDNDAETKRIRKLAERLAKTRWQVATGLKAIPYIKGTPAGTPRSVDVIWKDEILYVEDLPVARLFKQIAQEIARPFERSDIVEAISACAERSPDFISEYLKANFKLVPLEEIKPLSAEKNDQPFVSLKTEENSMFHKTMSEEISAFEHANNELEPENKKENQSNMTQYKDEQNIGEKYDDKDEISQSKPSSRHSKPQLIERFALSKGYIKNGTNRFSHPDGSWIQQFSENIFPWERYSPSGELQQCYWVKEHCIEHKPLQIEAEVWELCEKYPNKYTLLLTNSKGEPVEFSGEILRKLKNDGQISLYPAKYRLVYNVK